MESVEVKPNMVGVSSATRSEEYLETRHKHNLVSRPVGVSSIRIRSEVAFLETVIHSVKI